MTITRLTGASTTKMVEAMGLKMIASMSPLMASPAFQI
jgi:hypothetical protein